MDTQVWLNRAQIKNIDLFKDQEEAQSGDEDKSSSENDSEQDNDMIHQSMNHSNLSMVNKQLDTEEQKAMTLLAKIELGNQEIENRRKNNLQLKSVLDEQKETLASLQEDLQCINNQLDQVAEAQDNLNHKLEMDAVLTSAFEDIDEYLEKSRHDTLAIEIKTKLSELVLAVRTNPVHLARMITSKHLQNILVFESSNFPPEELLKLQDIDAEAMVNNHFLRNILQSNNFDSEMLANKRTSQKDILEEIQRIMDRPNAFDSSTAQLELRQMHDLLKSLTATKNSMLIGRKEPQTVENKPAEVTDPQEAIRLELQERKRERREQVKMVTN
jgi:hypothetical protein